MCVVRDAVVAVVCVVRDAVVAMLVWNNGVCCEAAAACLGGTEPYGGRLPKTH